MRAGTKHLRERFRWQLRLQQHERFKIAETPIVDARKNLFAFAITWHSPPQLVACMKIAKEAPLKPPSMARERSPSDYRYRVRKPSKQLGSLKLLHSLITHPLMLAGLRGVWQPRSA